MEKGLLHVYYGNGKGKTTCAVGLSVRAAGNGRKVLFVQFMKTGKSSEIKVLEDVAGIEIMEAPRLKKFSFQMNDEEKRVLREQNDRALSDIIKRAEEGDFDLLVMDECLGTLHKKLLDEGRLISFLDSRPAGLEVVLTGRHPDDLIMERADYVSEIHKVKHPYDKGVYGRKGIEF